MNHLRPDAFIREDFEKHGMLNASVNDVHLVDTCIERVER
jgi:hypothetical protein